jgi:pre-mRNA-processing factor 40
MNPMPGQPGAPVLWQEARNAEGRVYYYNVQTKVTQWAKPIELMTPVEVCSQLQSSTTLN